MTTVVAVAVAAVGYVVVADSIVENWQFVAVDAGIVKTTVSDLVVVVVVVGDSAAVVVVVRSRWSDRQSLLGG